MELIINKRLTDKLLEVFKELSFDSAVSSCHPHAIVSSVWKHTSRTAWYKMRQPRMLTVIHKEKVVAMLPVISNMSGSRYKMLTDMRGISSCDALFNTCLSTTEKVEAADKLATWLIHHRFALKRISSDSMLAKTLENNGYPPYRKAECCKIIIDKPYDEWFKTLPKSVRQNIRTAYNRLNRDSLEYQIVTGNSTQLFSTSLQLYCQRQNEAYISGSNAKKFLKLWRVQYENPVTKALKKDGTHILLYINKKPAACISGFLSAGKTALTVPRLAINSAFRAYSPGYILICEIIKLYHIPGITFLIDLGRGMEKYKLDLGATCYTTSDFRK